MSRRTIDPELAARAAARMRDRDWLIYEQVRGWNLRQVDVARAFGLTQARVSQIVRDVSRRLAAATPPGMAELEQLRDEQSELRACQRRSLQHLVWANEIFLRSGQPLKTTKKGRRGKVEYEETTTRERPRDLQALKLMVRINDRLEKAAAAKAKVSGCERGGVRERSHGDDHTPKPSDAHTLAPAATATATPAEEPGVYNDPVVTGRFYARRRLDAVREGRLSLFDAETLNQQSGLSNGAEYPSYYEKCDENINGVRVADWVRERVPPERLPQGDDVWLPVYHNLRGWEPEGRQIVANWSDISVDGAPSGYHFGPDEVGSAGSAEPEAAERHEVGSAGSAEPERPLDVAAPRAGSSPQEEPTVPRQPTYIERRLASGRRLPARERRRLELLARVRRERLEVTNDK